MYVSMNNETYTTDRMYIYINLGRLPSSVCGYPDFDIYVFAETFTHYSAYTHAYIDIYLCVPGNLFFCVYATQAPCTSQRTSFQLLLSLKYSLCIIFKKNEAPHPHTHLDQEFVLASVFMSLLQTPIDEFFTRGST